MSWTCPHQQDGKCTKRGKPCEVGASECVLAEKFIASKEVHKPEDTSPPSSDDQYLIEHASENPRDQLMVDIMKRN